MGSRKEEKAIPTLCEEIKKSATVIVVGIELNNKFMFDFFFLRPYLNIVEENCFVIAVCDCISVCENIVIAN